MKNIIKKTGKISIIIIIITLILFIAALYTKGFTHELFLEVAVFLVSVKLIIMADKNSSIDSKIIGKLDELDKKIEMINKKMKQ